MYNRSSLFVCSQMGLLSGVGAYSQDFMALLKIIILLTLLEVTLKYHTLQ